MMPPEMAIAHMKALKIHKNIADANLGLHIASWGFGAEMMYSLNFGFWSSNSFFSPEDVTSGFTGSGGFSLLWGPFVQPCEEKVTVLDSHKIKAQAVLAMAKVPVNNYETTDNRDITMENRAEKTTKVKQRTYNNAEEVWEVSSSSLAAGPSLKEITETLALIK